MKRSKIEKITWLQKNYRPYTTKWYGEDEGRLNAIFNTQYQKYLDALIKGTNDEHRSELESLAFRLRKAYKEYYQSDYDSDFILDRHTTHAKAMAIRDSWASRTLV